METLFLVAILLLALSSSSFTRGQTIVHIPPPRPLCASQYALANYACSRLPMNTVPLPSPIAPPPPPIFPPPDHDHDHDHDHDDDHDHDHDGDDHDHHDHDHDDDDHHHNHHDHDHDHNRDHDHDHNNHGHDHDDDDHDHHHHNDNSHRRHHRRRHHHHHHHHRHREETYAQQECCKWVKQMDNECVCDLLVRLPPLLAKPAHNYTVFVDESCIVTFTCGGRLIR
ncbi:PREDICTED: histone-lysine N-methyltransferase set1-like [Brassica oleracea var. oleracea]|uniref:histone-lysine N-methyltransferase set1-like n=1 Tax=Brassica oleracea var. oleracea TaxID=109376 RepID=UPI0006A71C52|nr:PREDICTED: histone-lysine N-methyltransferase set1-like [Brassica oleracea var. oleracea]